jgi:hypothetical protein
MSSWDVVIQECKSCIAKLNEKGYKNLVFLEHQYIDIFVQKMSFI